MRTSKSKLIKNIIVWGRKTALIILVLCLSFSSKNPFLPRDYQGEDLHVILSAMPEKDRNNLSFFFRELFETTPFSYVLLGEKPMAIDTIVKNINPVKHLWSQEDKEANLSNVCQPTLFEKFIFYCRLALSYKRLKMIQGYEIWKSYEKFFPLKRFVFFYHQTPYSGANHLTIGLINKKIFERKVNQHLDDFRTILKYEIDGKGFLNDLIQSQKNLDLILAHNGLLGILLGYGRDNAFLFHARSHIKTAQEVKLFCKQNHFKFVWGKENIHLSLPSTNGLHSIALPCFAADITSLETEVLRKEYLDQRAKIIDYYEGKDFLEETLRLLISTEKL